MKKYIIVLLISILFLPTSVFAKKIKVKLDKCIDGDTVSVIMNKETVKVRFLAIDAPEIDKEEPYSTEAKDFTCELLTSAKNIYLEKDPAADEADKYNRYLAWVWADDILVQKELVEIGYAKIAYLYSEYKYDDELKEFENYAKENKLNIWALNKEIKNEEKDEKKVNKIDKFLKRLNTSYEYIALLIAAILALITFYRKQKK